MSTTSSISTATPPDLNKPLATSEHAKRRRQELIAEREKSSFGRYMSSVGYGLLSAFTTYPIMRARVMMECRPDIAILGRETPFTGYWSAFRHIVKNEGLFKLFRGIAPFMAFTIPLTFARQSAVSAFAQDFDSSYSPMNGFVRGFAATSVASLVAAIFTPFSVAATKLMADTRPAKRAIYEYQGPVSCMRRVSTIAGRSALWTGAIPFWLHNLTYFSTLYTSSFLFSLSGISHVSPVLATLAASMLGVYVAQPFNIIHSRMQYRLHTQVIDHIPQYKGMVDCASQIWKTEGFRGFFRGSLGAVAIYAMTTMWLMVSTARGHKNKDKNAKNEMLLQRRLEHSTQHRDRFRKERIEDAVMYGFDDKLKL